MDEAQEIISEEKRDCDKIWDSSYDVMSETGLPRIEKSEMIMPGDSKLETMEKEHQDKEMAIQQLKEVGWNAIKTLLVDEIHSQTLIKTWTSGTEVNLRKKVMKSVCRENLMFEGYRPESLVALIEVTITQRSEFLG